MRTPLVAAQSFALLLGATACADSPVAPDLPLDPPSLRAERFLHFTNFLLGGDPENGLALQAGFDPGTTAEQICQDPGGHGITGEGAIVFTPAGRVNVHTSDRDASLVVYAFSDGPITGQCDLVGAPVVATGTGRFTFRFSEGGRGAVTAHIIVQGTVTLVGGGDARVWATARVTIRPDGTVVHGDELVRLTPL